MPRPRSLNKVERSDIPGPEETEEILKGVVRGTGKISSVGVDRAGQEVYIIVKKVLE